MRHSTISSRVRPFTALTAVERLAVSSSAPTCVAASLPVCRSMTWAWADCCASQRSFAMTSRMPEISVSLSRTSGIERSKCCGPMRKTSLASRSHTDLSNRETSSIRPRVCLNCSFSLNSAMTFLSRGWNG